MRMRKENLHNINSLTIMTIRHAHRKHTQTQKGLDGIGSYRIRLVTY